VPYILYIYALSRIYSYISEFKTCDSSRLVYIFTYYDFARTKHKIRIYMYILLFFRHETN